jgi:hypothetical protein
VYEKLSYHFDLTPNPSPRERGALDPKTSASFFKLELFKALYKRLDFIFASIKVQ